MTVWNIELAMEIEGRGPDLGSHVIPLSFLSLSRIHLPAADDDKDYDVEPRFCTVGPQPSHKTLISARENADFRTITTLVLVQLPNPTVLKVWLLPSASPLEISSRRSSFPGKLSDP